MKTLAISLAFVGLSLSSYSFNTSPSALPSADDLVFPVSGARSNIGSFFGDSRSGGKRKHEGIDIFAKKGTPVVAVCDGYITAVENGGLGGKTVWLRSEDGEWSAYYAHLDIQKVSTGQFVQQGDILGTVGNTGNAKYTPSHLHFGIYTYSGAINPLPYVKTSRKVLKPTEADPNNAGNDAWARNSYNRKSYESEEYTDDAEPQYYNADGRSEYRMPARSNANRNTRTTPAYGNHSNSNETSNNNSGFPKQYILKTIELNGHKEAYYITTQYNFIRVTNGKTEVLGRWAETDSEEYPNCIVNGRKILYYVDEAGLMVTPTGEEAGYLE